MTHRSIIRIEAEVDITDAAVQEERGLGYTFLAEIDAAIAAAAESPFSLSAPPAKTGSPSRTDESVPLPSILRPDDNIVVFRVLHSSCHDREWKSNVPK